jgi:hypothetical protein
MTRYFYPASRAHHAYCMARDFGMEFERRFGKWEPEGLLHIDPASSYRIYVHRDSLHLLDPRKGDVVINPDGCPAWVGARGFYEDFGITGEVAWYGIRTGAASIATRDGKPFHWPEVEHG